jgi:putative FmdB family regulatory protein
MPIYDFHCQNAQCAEPEFESLQKMGVEEIDCPTCTSKATRNPVANLRKNGWYANASSLRIHFNWMSR